MQQLLVLLRRKAGRKQEIGKADDAAEWRADLVADRRQHLRFGEADALSLRLGVAQLGGELVQLGQVDAQQHDAAVGGAPLGDAEGAPVGRAHLDRSPGIGMVLEPQFEPALAPLLGHGTVGQACPQDLLEFEPDRCPVGQWILQPAYRLVARHQPILSIEEALAREDVKVHDSSKRGNVFKEVHLSFGDLEAGFAAGSIRKRT